MSRTRLAVLLALLAGACLLVTGGLAVATYVGGDDPPPAARPVVVTDPGSGARFAVPHGWRRTGARHRVSYGAASVQGPALLAAGYCRKDPDGSFRALAGFTDATFDVWVEGVRGGRAAWSSGVSRRRVTLADGTRAVLAHTSLLLPQDACSSGGVDLAMVEAGGVRVVVVADTGDDRGALDPAELDEIARTLQLP